MGIWISKTYSPDDFPYDFEFTEATKEQCAKMIKDHEERNINISDGLLEIARRVAKEE